MFAQRPLSGIRILDLSRLLPGPFATFVLAELGAEVDKVEDADAGDYLRHMPPSVDGINAVFRVLHRGKRSVVLDLKREEGRAAFLRLVPRYDVLVESFRPGVMERLGLSYDVLSALHPGLVMCAITGYGQTGPLAGRAGHDLDYLARSGVLSLGGPSEGPPEVPGTQLADVGGGGLVASTQILAALFARSRTGRGAYLDVAMCDGAASFGAFGLLSHLAGLDCAAGRGPLMGGIAPYRTYATRDGKAVALGALEPKFWAAFSRAVGLPVDMNALAPGPHQAEIIEQLTAIFASRTRAEWEAFAARHDVCLEPVLTPEEAVNDPHLRARDVLGYTSEGVPYLRWPGGNSPELPAPAQGEHGDAILGEAGFTPEEIAELKRLRVTR